MLSFTPAVVRHVCVPQLYIMIHYYHLHKLPTTVSYQVVGSLRNVNVLTRKDRADCVNVPDHGTFRSLPTAGELFQDETF
jgi:hypothetical protein